jgi:hypothetical protein
MNCVKYEGTTFTLYVCLWLQRYVFHTKATFVSTLRRNASLSTVLAAGQLSSGQTSGGASTLSAVRSRILSAAVTNLLCSSMATVGVLGGVKAHVLICDLYSSEIIILLTG